MAELIGYAGAALLLAAYAMVSFHKWRPDSLMYQSVNIGAAFLLAMYSFDKHAYANILINAFAIIIGVSALVAMAKSSKTTGKRRGSRAKATVK